MQTTISGYKVNYTITGNGEETAVILQGWGTTQAHYGVIVNALSDRFRVVTLDLPGFGTSTEPKEVWNVDRYVDFFLEFAREMGIRRTVLIGHSFGGRMIIKLCSRKQEDLIIDRIVLIDAAGIQRKKSLRVRMKIKRYKLLKSFMNSKLMKFVYGSLTDEWMNMQGSADYRAATPMMRKCLVMAVNEDLTALLGQCTPETLLIWGEKDVATPLCDGRLMEERMPNASLVVIPGAGHFSFAEKPDIFTSIIKAFL